MLTTTLIRSSAHLLGSDLLKWCPQNLLKRCGSRTAPLHVVVAVLKSGCALRHDGGHHDGYHQCAGQASYPVPIVLGTLKTWVETLSSECKQK